MIQLNDSPVLGNVFIFLAGSSIDSLNGRSDFPAEGGFGKSTWREIYKQAGSSVAHKSEDEGRHSFHQ